MLITFEGIDGSGKTTQAKMLADFLTEFGWTVCLTREPGGTEMAEKIRELVLSDEAANLSPESLLLLIAAARRDHVEKVIAPALEAGHTVICDRFVDSTEIYQVHCGDANALLARSLQIVSTEIDGVLIVPDLTIIIDVSVSTAEERIRHREQSDRYDAALIKELAPRRDGYWKIYGRDNRRMVMIDGDGTPEDVFSRVRAVFMNYPSILKILVDRCEDDRAAGC